MNILVINQPLNNRGDESAHKALVRTLLNQLPDAKITVLFVKSNADSIRQFSVDNPRVCYLNIQPSFLYRRFSLSAMRKGQYFMWYLHPTTLRLMALYKKADWVVCAPGGICMGGFQNWGHLYFLKMAQRLNKKIAYFGRSIGPFPTETEDNRWFKKESLELLHGFDYISLRDSKSEDLANQIGIEFFSTVDTAFLETPRADIPLEIKKQIGEKYVVFVPNLLIWHFAYKNRITKESVLHFYKLIFDEIVNKWPDSKIVLLPQTFNYGTYEGDDINFFNEMSDYINDERIVVVPDTYSSDIQQTIISKSVCMVGARYHSIVFAINNKVPFVALSYEHKINGLLNTLGAEERMIDITHGLDNVECIKQTLAKFKEILSVSIPMDVLCDKAKGKVNVGFGELKKLIKD